MSFRAIETATGRPVLVHLFVNAAAPSNVALLAKADRLPVGELGRIVDRGQHNGAPYLVTDRLPEYPGLREWLEAAGSAAAEAKPLSTAAAAGSKDSLDDQFASLFEAAGHPPEVKGQPQRAVRRDDKTEEVPPPAPVPPSAPVVAPGAFTQLFQASVASKQAPPPVPPAPPAPPPASAAPPGAFTQMFQAPVAAPKPAPPASPAPPPLPASAPPGAFTELFQAPLAVSKPASREPGAPPAPPPLSAQPGAFTELFQAPLAVSKPSRRRATRRVY